MAATVLRWHMNQVPGWSRPCCGVESCERPAPDIQFNVVDVLRIAEQIVRDAIRRAGGAIVFYRGLKGFAQGSETLMRIDDMIAEEERHIRQLSRSLEQMPSRRSTEGCDPSLSSHPTEAESPL